MNTIQKTAKYAEKRLSCITGDHSFAGPNSYVPFDHGNLIPPVIVASRNVDSLPSSIPLEHRRQFLGRDVFPGRQCARSKSGHRLNVISTETLQQDSSLVSSCHLF